MSGTIFPLGTPIFRGGTIRTYTYALTNTYVCNISLIALALLLVSDLIPVPFVPHGKK